MTSGNWDDLDATVERLLQRRDDFERMVIRVVACDVVVGQKTGSGAFGELDLCNGESDLISLNVVEQLINDPRFQAMRIPVRLVPTSETPT